MDFLAKSLENGGMSLFEHSVRCAEKCAELARMSNLEEPLVAASYLCGLLHDCGKATETFQRYLKGEGVEQKFNHSVVSAFIVNECFDFIGLNTNRINNQIIVSTILNHHPITKDEKPSDFYDIVSDKADLCEFLNKLVDHYNNSEFGEKYQISFDIDRESLSNINISYMTDSEAFNSMFILFSSILRFADILSSGGNVDVDSLLKLSHYGELSIEKPEGYDGDRFEQQLQASKELLSHGLSMLSATTGYGKCLVGALFALQDNKKCYWICPRNSVAEGVFETLSKEINNLNLTEKVSCALLLGGDYVGSNNDDVELYKAGKKIPDITVTNIDNFLRPIVNTDSNIRIYTMLYSNCIFDEFHEYLTNEPLLAAFQSILRCRKCYCTESHTILMSATPNKDLYSGLHDDVYEMIIPNEQLEGKQIKIQFADSLKGINVVDSDTMIYASTVETCQCNANKANDIIHARFTDCDRETKNKMVYEHHGKEAQDRNYSIIGNKVISTGLDISFNHAVIVNPIPDVFQQLLGRINRWLTYEETPVITLVSDFNKSESVLIKETFNVELAKKYYQYLKENIEDGTVITIKELSTLTDGFIETEKESYRKLFKTFKSNSLSKIGKIKYVYSSRKQDDEVIHLSNKVSFRCAEPNNMFVFVPNSEMEEPMQIEITRSVEEYLKDDKNIELSFKYIDKHDDLIDRYFGNKYAFDKRKEKLKGVIQLKETLLNLSKHSNTPFILVNDYEYTKKLGLVRKK